MPIQQSFLIEKASSYRRDFSEYVEASDKTSTYKTAFLCHSHLDQILVAGLLRYFEELQIQLYVDWNDHSMPDSPNKETATKIQAKIKETDVFLFLATANSKASRWCPWEIGYADSSYKNIYIIPTEDRNSNYGNEYLSLYPKIDMGTHRQTSRQSLAVFNPMEDSGVFLAEAKL